MSREIAPAAPLKLCNGRFRWLPLEAFPSAFDKVTAQDSYSVGADLNLYALSVPYSDTRRALLDERQIPVRLRVNTLFTAG